MSRVWASTSIPSNEAQYLHKLATGLWHETGRGERHSRPNGCAVALHLKPFRRIKKRPGSAPERFPVSVQGAFFGSGSCFDCRALATAATATPACATPPGLPAPWRRRHRRVADHHHHRAPPRPRPRPCLWVWLLDLVRFPRTARGHGDADAHRLSGSPSVRPSRRCTKGNRRTVLAGTRRAADAVHIVVRHIRQVDSCRRVSHPECPDRAPPHRWPPAP